MRNIIRILLLPKASGTSVRMRKKTTRNPLQKPIGVKIVKRRIVKKPKMKTTPS